MYAYEFEDWQNLDEQWEDADKDGETVDGDDNHDKWKNADKDGDEDDEKWKNADKDGDNDLTVNIYIIGIFLPILKTKNEFPERFRFSAGRGEYYKYGDERGLTSLDVLYCIYTSCHTYRRVMSRV